MLEPINRRQLEILRHALGWPISYRNHFVTGEGSDDFPDCLVLEGLGLMSRTQRDWIPRHIFTVTARGRELVESELPKPGDAE